MKETRKITLLTYWLTITKHRRVLMFNTIIITVLAIIISLLLTPQFRATAIILPPGGEQPTMFSLLSSGLPAGISSLSRITGGLPGLATPSDLYAAIMKSGRIKGTIIKRFNLMKEFKSKTTVDASKALDKITKIEVSPEGLISVAVTYKNKYLAADIANAYIEELDKFNRETAMTTGKKYRIFIEKRLKETEDSLTKTEESLRNFQEKHRTIALDTEIEKAIETIATLKSQIILKEVQKGAAGGINNPYIRSIDQELRELKKQLAKIEFGSGVKGRDEFGAGFSVPLSKLPEVSLEYARLLRDVKVQEAIYELLTQQYEQAKIMEVKDTPTVQLLDRASPPEKRCFPVRSKIVIFAFILSLIINVPLALFADYLIDTKRNPKDHQTFNKIMEDLSRGLGQIKKFFTRKK